MASRLARLVFSYRQAVKPANPEKYLLEVLFTFSQHVKELFLGSRLALALFLAKWWGSAYGGGNDFVVSGSCG
jgi:hypothetical protein